ncbi:LOW QUALITY PROTEIN: hypothetical protein ACHAWX_000332 [Stephanocyclus meneghinianus]
MVTRSCKIRGIVGEYLSSHTATYMGNALINVTHFYSGGGYVSSFNGMEFICLSEKFPFVIINTSAACEHLAEIK